MAGYSKIPYQDRNWCDESADVACVHDSGLFDEKLLSTGRMRDTKFSSTWLGLLWILSLILAVTMTTITLSNNKDALGTFASGYSTEFSPAHEALTLRQQTFTGSPRFDEHGKEYIPVHSPSLRYIGSEADVDAAWNKLMENRYFLLTDEEAEKAWGSNYREFWDDQAGGYLGGLDVFHTLHCLDHLRKSFYPDVYHLDGIHGEMHQLHCIDHLRQMIQCNSDLTIIPTRWYLGIDQNYIDSSRTHTCRDFDRVREWASNRYNGTQAVPARSRNETS